MREWFDLYNHYFRVFLSFYWVMLSVLINHNYSYFKSSLKKNKFLHSRFRDQVSPIQTELADVEDKVKWNRDN